MSINTNDPVQAAILAAQQAAAQVAILPPQAQPQYYQPQQQAYQIPHPHPQYQPQAVVSAPVAAHLPESFDVGTLSDLPSEDDMNTRIDAFVQGHKGIIMLKSTRNASLNGRSLMVVKCHVDVTNTVPVWQFSPKMPPNTQAHIYLKTYNGEDLFERGKKVEGKTFKQRVTELMQLYPESSSPYKTAEVVFIVADDTLDAYQQVVPKGTTLGWTPPYTNVGIFGDLYKAEHDIKKNIGEIPDPKDPSKMIKIIPNVQLSIEAVPNSKNNTMRIQMKKVD